MRKRMLFGVCAAALGGIVLTAETMRTAAAGKGRPVVDVPHSTTGSESETVIRAEGRVVTYPDATIEVGAEVGGRIVRVLVQEEQQVHRGDVIAEIAAEEARAAVAEARARIAEADADTALFMTEQRRSTSLVQSGSLPRQTLDRITHDLDAARARRAVGEATLERLGALLAKTVIRAPISGTVTVRSVQPGETVIPGTPLVTIADLRRRRIEAEVDEYDAGKVRIGTPVTITAEGYGGRRWQGSTETVPAIVVSRRLKPDDPGRPSDTRVLLVKVTLPPDAPLKLGQRVEVTIRAAAQ